MSLGKQLDELLALEKIPVKYLRGIQYVLGFHSLITFLCLITLLRHFLHIM